MLITVNVCLTEFGIFFIVATIESVA